MTEQDLVELTNDEVDGDAVVEAVYEAVRSQADSIIDGHVGTRYIVPIDDVPALIADASMSLTVYRLYRRRYSGKIPDQVVEDHKLAMELLQNIAAGKVSLGLPTASTPSQNPFRKGQLTSHDRIFTRDGLKGF